MRSSWSLAGSSHRATLVLFLSTTEDRPGHELKLHQYSSTDIRDIVQRQVRVRCLCSYRGGLSLIVDSVTQHQGEKDIKGPGDFSGSGTKLDDNGDADEDGLEDDEEPVKTGKRKAGGKSSVPSDATSNDVRALFCVYSLFSESFG